MSVKASISLTEAQEADARDLVAQGRYSSMSAVIQQGLELLRDESQTTDALRELLDARRSGPFISQNDGQETTHKMISRKRSERSR